MYREGESLPLGPAQTAECGDDIVFEELPAGHQVFVSASLSDGPNRQWEGASDTVTIVANGVTEATATLSAVDPPVLDAVAPDPAAPGDVLTLTGSELHRTGATSRVEWSCDGGVDADSATKTSVVATLPASASATTVRVARCGVGSNALPLRIAAPPDVEPLSPPGCDGLSIRAMAEDIDGSILLAVACDDGAGELLRLLPDDCTFATVAELEAPPTAVTAYAGRALVGTAAGIIVVASGTATSPGAGLAEPVHALADDDKQAWIIAGDGNRTLYQDSAGKIAEVQGISDLELRDVAAATGAIVVAADGKLIVLDPMTGNSDDLGNVACDPVAVDARFDSALVAIACADGVIGYDLSTKSWTTHVPGITATDVALDAPGDAAFAVESAGGVLHAVDLVDARAFGPWPLDEAAAPLLHAGDNRLLTGAAAMIAGWAGVPLCDGGGR